MSKIEVNTVAPQCGTTLTLGESGDTVTLGSGASQSGFGRTGTVDWDTTPKTATFSAVSGNGYFVNTTAGVITVNLPAGVAGAIVSLADYAATWQTYNVTVTPNGTDKIGSSNENATLSTEGQSVTLVYVDSTQGWINTMDSTSNVRPNPFIVATGGTITTVCTDYKVHTFTGPATFTVTNAGTPAGSNTVDYMIVAGGGGGGNNGGGAGAGGFRESSGTASGSYTASPLGSGVSALPVLVQGYPISVGGGGSATTGYNGTVGTSGSNSVFSTITSTGGGRGAHWPSSSAGTGGSGGGGGCGSPINCGAAGNTPSVSPPQGNPGGDASGPVYGAGGGATAAGANGTPSGPAGGAGGTTSISASPTAYAGGGGGATFATPGPGGIGGGGAGSGPEGTGTAGTVNTGGGGGGAAGGSAGPSGAGGSGIVIIRYKFQ